jgi:hypothetical protein
MYKVAIILILLWPGLAVSATEKDHQIKYCAGIIEHYLPDKTRVDCLTETHAIEYDYGRKWAEAIGQSLHYAAMTGKEAGIVIIYKGEKDERYITRMNKVINRYQLPIKVWLVDHIEQ